jgi:hypothetical protein
MTGSIVESWSAGRGEDESASKAKRSTTETIESVSGGGWGEPESIPGSA